MSVNLYSSTVTPRDYGTFTPKPAEKVDPGADPFDELFVKWYMKTGLFCKMDYVTFINQPYLAMKAITKEIDKRLESQDSILNYEHLALLLALAKLFGSK